MIKHIKHIFAEFEHGIDKWDDPRERMFEGTMVKGRPTRGFGDSTFNYAGKVYEPEPWSHEIKLIKIAAEKIASKEFKRDVEFTFCLCGLYETGDDSIPHHSDTIPTLQDVVLGISFGGTRVFEWNNYDTSVKEHTNTSQINLDNKGEPETTQFLAEDGDVYMFDGHSQMKSTHSVPPLIGCRQRVSLTFRSGL